MAPTAHVLPPAIISLAVDAAMPERALPQPPPFVSSRLGSFLAQSASHALATLPAGHDHDDDEDEAPSAAEAPSTFTSFFSAFSSFSPSSSRRAFCTNGTICSLSATMGTASCGGSTALARKIIRTTLVPKPPLPKPRAQNHLSSKRHLIMSMPPQPPPSAQSLVTQSRPQRPTQPNPPLLSSRNPPLPPVPAILRNRRRYLPALCWCRRWTPTPSRRTSAATLFRSAPRARRSLDHRTHSMCRQGGAAAGGRTRSPLRRPAAANAHQQPLPLFPEVRRLRLRMSRLFTVPAPRRMLLASTASMSNSIIFSTNKAPPSSFTIRVPPIFTKWIRLDQIGYDASNINAPRGATNSKQSFVGPLSHTPVGVSFETNKRKNKNKNPPPQKQRKLTTLRPLTPPPTE